MKTLIIILALLVGVGCTHNLHVHYHITVEERKKEVEKIYGWPGIGEGIDFSNPTPPSVLLSPYIIFNPPGDTLWIYPDKIKPKKK